MNSLREKRAFVYLLIVWLAVRLTGATSNNKITLIQLKEIEIFPSKGAVVIRIWPRRFHLRIISNRGMKGLLLVSVKFLTISPATKFYAKVHSVNRSFFISPPLSVDDDTVDEISNLWGRTHTFACPLFVADDDRDTGRKLFAWN